MIAYGNDADGALLRSGATGVRNLSLISAASGLVRADAVTAVLDDSGVSHVASDAPVQLNGDLATSALTPVALEKELQNLYPRVDGATGAWSSGVDGAGVGIALIDSGAADLPDFEGRLTHVTFDTTIAAVGDVLFHESGRVSGSGSLGVGGV